MKRSTESNRVHRLVVAIWAAVRTTNLTTVAGAEHVRAYVCSRTVGPQTISAAVELVWMLGELLRYELARKAEAAKVAPPIAPPSRALLVEQTARDFAADLGWVAPPAPHELPTDTGELHDFVQQALAEAQAIDGPPSVAESLEGVDVDPFTDRARVAVLAELAARHVGANAEAHLNAEGGIFLRIACVDGPRDFPIDQVRPFDDDQKLTCPELDARALEFLEAVLSPDVVVVGEPEKSE